MTIGGSGVRLCGDLRDDGLCISYCCLEGREGTIRWGS